MSKPLIAIVGRPNVGKSTLFNKLTGQRLSIVEDTPGVTRDRIYAPGEWCGREFMLVDTGGIEPKADDLMLSKMRMQAQIAIDAADVIIFVVDLKSGVTANDADIAHMLQKCGKPVVLCVNKCDSLGDVPPDFYEFYNLGLGDPYPVSSVHGHGTGDLLDACIEKIDWENRTDYPEEYTKVAVIGKPNVGKSSLLNRLFNRKSLARVSSVPGKTVTVNFYDVDGVHFVDLPGYGYAKISKAEKKRFGELMEGYFQSGRPIRLVVQLIDMRHAPTADDLQMIDFLQQIGLPFVVVLTKADKLKPTQYKKRLEELGTELPNLGTGVQVIPFSSVKGQGSEQLKAVIEQACQSE